MIECTPEEDSIDLSDSFDMFSQQNCRVRLPYEPLNGAEDRIEPINFEEQEEGESPIAVIRGVFEANDLHLSPLPPEVNKRKRKRKRKADYREEDGSFKTRDKLGEEQHEKRKANDQKRK